MNNLYKQFIILTICLFFANYLIFAQQQKSCQWVNQLGGKSWDVCGGMVSANNDMIYITGSFLDTLFCHDKKIISSGNQDIFIARFNQRGDLKDLWKAGGNGCDNATCITATGNNIIFAGNVSDTVAFGPIKVNAIDNSFFIACLSEKGKYLWANCLSLVGKGNLLQIGADARDNVYVAGYYDGILNTGDFAIESKKTDIFLFKINSGGKVEKLISIGGIGDESISALAVNSSGNILLAGSNETAFNCGELEFSSARKNFNSKAFAVCLDSDLQPIWKNQISGEEYCEVSSFGFDKQDNVYLTGSFNMGILISDTTLQSNGYSDCFLIKLDSTGNIIWKRTFGSQYNDYVSNLVIDNLNGSIITGSMGDTLIIDSLKLSPLSEKNSAMFVQFSPEGELVWADCISGDQRTSGDGIALDKSGNLYLSGAFMSSFSKGNELINSTGDQDIFIAKYLNCRDQNGEIIGNSFICEGESIQLSVKSEYSNVIWNDTIAGTNYITACSPGIYTVKMLDKKGCRLVDTLEVKGIHASSFTLRPNLSLSADETLTLKAPSYLENIFWQDGSSDSYFLVKTCDITPGINTFWVTGLDSLGCTVSDTINISYYDANTLENPGISQITVFPNPVENVLNWSVISEKECHFLIEISDANGRIVYNSVVKRYHSNTLMTIDFSDIPYGNYQMRLISYKGESYGNISLIKK